MDIHALIPIILQVLKNPYVIATVVVIVLYMNFCSYVANYVKKPPKPKKRRPAPAPKPEPVKKEENEEDDEETDDDSHEK